MNQENTRYVNPYVAGVMLGLLLFASFFVTSHGLGSSGGLARCLVLVQDFVCPAHVDNNAYLASMAGGTKNPLDHWVVWTVFGMLAGGLLSGWLAGRVRVETHKGPRIGKTTRWLCAFGGGILVGYGAQIARGCTSGQALSGGATLAVGSWAFMFSVFGGGYLLAYFVRRLWR